MQLISLKIERQGWGKDKGLMTGEIAFENREAKVTVKLDEAKAYKMLEIVAAQVVENAQETAQFTN